MKLVSKNIKFFAAATIAATSIIAFPASAYDMSFKYDRTELQKPSSAQNLYKRLERQVKSHCRINGRKPLSQIISERDCTKEMMDDIISQIDDPYITAMHHDGDRIKRIAQRN